MGSTLSAEQRHRLLETEKFITALDNKFQGKLEFEKIKREDGSLTAVSRKYDKNSFELGFSDYRKFLSILSESKFIETAKRYGPEFQFGFLQFLSTPDLELEEGLKNSLQRMNQILHNVSQSVENAGFKKDVKMELGEQLAYVAFNFNWPVAREVIENLVSPRSVKLINKDSNNIPLHEYSKSVAEAAFQTALRNTVRNGTELL